MTLHKVEPKKVNCNHLRNYSQLHLVVGQVRVVVVVVVIDAPFRSKESRLQQSTTDTMVVCNIQPYLFIYQRTEL
jgi:hypothetical protein